MYHRTPLSIEVPKVLKLLVYTLLGMMFMISVYFFIKTSSTAEMGYTLRENQLSQEKLQSENRMLKQRLLDTQSLTELQSSKILKEMVPPTGTIFVAPPAPISRRSAK